MLLFFAHVIYLIVMSLILFYTFYIVPVQGGWTSWLNIPPCSSQCADGMQTRERGCTNPTPKFGGENCIGESADTVQCGSNSCGKYVICILL